MRYDLLVITLNTILFMAIFTMQITTNSTTVGVVGDWGLPNCGYKVQCKKGEMVDLGYGMVKNKRSRDNRDKECSARYVMFC